jgi:hypothetical protein
MMNILKRWPLYPWLFVLYPILFVYSRNVGEVFALEVLLFIGIFFALAALIFGIFYWAIRNPFVSAAMLFVLVITFFTYGHVANLTSSIIPEIALMYTYVLLCVFGIGMIFRTRHLWDFSHMVSSLNLIGAILIAMTLPPLIGYLSRSLTQPTFEVDEHPHLDNSPERPDIYYIVLDAYSSNSHFLRDYGYDNSAFTDALEERGFYVAYDSKTSYGLTVVSLSSVLNMRYIDENDEAAAAESRTQVHYFRTLMADSAVAGELESRGYTYIDMLSGFAVPSTIADINIDFYPDGPQYYYGAEGHQAALSSRRAFAPLLLATTSFHQLNDPQEAMQPLITKASYNFLAPERALMTWDEVEKIPEMPEATFTIVHIIKPHGPISFDQEGNLVDPATLQDNYRAFFDQLQFVNARTLAMIDAILEKSSTPPIIIMQGDHGSLLGSPQSLDNKRTNFEILNTYYLPGQADCITDRAIIPINSFRAVFNCYFETDYPMLEPQYFAMPGNYIDMFLFEPVDIDEWIREHEANPLYDPTVSP